MPLNLVQRFTHSLTPLATRKLKWEPVLYSFAFKASRPEGYLWNRALVSRAKLLSVPPVALIDVSCMQRSYETYTFAQTHLNRGCNLHWTAMSSCSLPDRELLLC